MIQTTILMLGKIKISYFVVRTIPLLRALLALIITLVIVVIVIPADRNITLQSINFVHLFWTLVFWIMLGLFYFSLWYFPLRFKEWNQAQLYLQKNNYTKYKVYMGHSQQDMQVIIEREYQPNEYESLLLIRYKFSYYVYQKS